MASEFPPATSVIESEPPEGWKATSLGGVADVRFSSVDKLTHPSEPAVRLCNYMDVYNYDYITGDLDFMRASASQAEIDRFGIQAGDVLITKDSETPNDIGISAVVDNSLVNLVCGYHLGLIRPNQSEVDPTFLAKQLGHQRITSYFGRQANGLTRYALPLASVRGIPLWLPERKEEQRAVGTVLRMVDDAITKSEVVVAGLKQVRTGLLHDLLTCGLDENGRLRDPFARPEQFRDWSIGRIPREWEVKTCDALCHQIVVGIVVKPAQYYVDKGVAALRSANVRENYINFEDLVYISHESNRVLGKSALRTDDLVTVRTGYPGTTSAIPECLDG